MKENEHKHVAGGILFNQAYSKLGLYCNPELLVSDNVASEPYSSVLLFR